MSVNADLIRARCAEIEESVPPWRNFRSCRLECSLQS